MGSKWTWDHFCNMDDKDAFKALVAYEARIAELEAEKQHLMESCMKVASESITNYQMAKSNLDLVDAVMAELARVKAESLRVVETASRPLVAHDWYMTPSGLGWWGKDKDGYECVETPDGYHEHADCKPVRLERWEIEE